MEKVPRRGALGRATTWIVIGATLLGAGPCAMCPGGRLDGDVEATTPADWRFVGDTAACAVEVRPNDPHSVRATCLQQGGTLYVSSIMAPRKRWPKMVADDDRVRVRIEGRLYALRAVRIDDVDERVRVLGGSADDPPGDSHWLWRFEAR